MKLRSALVPALLALVAVGGCVATQNVPVSTDPAGAAVFLDGKQVCETTPCSVSVPKDQNHLLTVIKPGFHQRDVALTRVFDTAGVLKEELRRGARKAATGADAGSVLSGAAQSVDKKEQDGSAYVLKPDLVVLRLTPADQPRPEDRAANPDDPFAEPSPDQTQPAPQRKDKVDPVEIGIDLYRILKGGAAPEDK